jgi:hypothetical protein
LEVPKSLNHKGSGGFMRFNGFRHSNSKKVHVVFFVDASEPKTLTFSEGIFKILVAIFVTFVLLAIGSIVAFSKQQHILTKNESFIRELKAGLVAYAAAEKQNPQFKSDLFESTVEEIRTAALIKPRIHTDNLNDLAKQLADSNKINSLDNATLSLAAASGVAENEDEVIAESVPTKDATPSSTRVSPKVTPVQEQDNKKSHETKEEISQVEEKKFLRARFQDFEVAPDPDRTNGTLFSFSLVNSDPDRPLSGRVCAVAVYKTSQGTFRFEAIPVSAGVNLTSPQQNDRTQEVFPSNCTWGEPVKFSRLRPTELELLGSSQDLTAVNLLFVESASKVPYRATWKNEK